MEADILVRRWIADVIGRRSDLVAIAMRQRAKFEGWLKFELAAYAQLKGAAEVTVEAATDDSSGSRRDLTFYYRGEKCNVELKTCNTNWRMTGVLDRPRPITKNVAGIIEDARKLQKCVGHGVVAACIFPVERGDRRWKEYLKRIGEEAGVHLSEKGHTTRVPLDIDDHCSADVVVVSFLTAKAGLA